MKACSASPETCLAASLSRAGRLPNALESSGRGRVALQALERAAGRFFQPTVNMRRSPPPEGEPRAESVTNMAKSKRTAARKQPALGVEAEEAPRKTRGRTNVTHTPVHIHTHQVELPDSMVEYVQTKLGARVGAFATQIDRVSVRFEDLNGPRGGKDCECRIQLTLAGRPNLVVSERALDAKRAFDGASRTALRALKHDLERAGFSQGLHAARKNARVANHEPSTASSAPPAPSSRNLRKNTPRSAAALELTAAGERPSRMSTRKSANHVRSGERFAQRAREEAHAPKTVAATARARRTRG